MSISIIKESMDFGGLSLSLETGKLARQADGSVLVRCGGTSVLVTVVLCNEQEGASFFPLNVQFVAKSYAIGKIPGGFIKREGKLSDREVLISRLIDRTIRPMFPIGFMREVGVICSLISYDPECVPEVPALIGSVVACMLADLPLCDVVAGVRVGASQDGAPCLEMSYPSMEADVPVLDMFVSASKDSIYMLEVGAREVSSSFLSESLRFAVNSAAPVIDFMKMFVTTAKGSEFIPVSRESVVESYSVPECFVPYIEEFRSVCLLPLKNKRSAALSILHQKIKENVSGGFESSSEYSSAAEKFEKYVIRDLAISHSSRVGGRAFDQIRDIDVESDLLQKAHGSALFTRGDTQSLVVTTLGTMQDAQIVDDWDGNRKEMFLLHYNFPPYAVGESSTLRSPGRREIGHGRLAAKAIAPVLPNAQLFPYTIRVVSEITSSDGSSSMATVCGTSLSLMDAGVPIKSPVAGIAMGCLLSEDNLIIFSDICGEEDFAGDMDFKVAGTKDGITAMQMDIKVAGVKVHFFDELLSKADEGRLYILGKMNDSLSVHRNVVKCGVPCIASFKIDKDKIRLVIGTGGRTVRDICEKSGAKIEVDQSGVVTVSGPDYKSIEKARSMISSLVNTIVSGAIYDGVVSRVTNFGAFIDLNNGKKGMVHVSEISDGRVESAMDVFEVGDAVRVIVLGEDRDGKLKLSVKQAIDKTAIPLPGDHPVGEDTVSESISSDLHSDSCDNSTVQALREGDHTAQPDSLMSNGKKSPQSPTKRKPMQRNNTASRRHAGAVVRDDSSSKGGKSPDKGGKRIEDDTSSNSSGGESSSSSSSGSSGAFSSPGSRFF